MVFIFLLLYLLGHMLSYEDNCFSLLRIRFLLGGPLKQRRPFWVLKTLGSLKPRHEGSVQF